MLFKTDDCQSERMYCTEKVVEKLAAVFVGVEAVVDVGL
jgi:hypothetical protein